MKNKRIYISGKMSGMAKEDYKKKFSNAEEYLEKLGFDVVNPSTVDSDIIPYNDLLWADLRILMSCDAIYMLDNWKNSKGAKAEYYFADAIGLEILFENEVITNCSNCHNLANKNNQDLTCRIDGKQINDTKLALHCTHFNKIFGNEDLL